MENLDPELRNTLFAIQKELILNISIHQYLVSKAKKCDNEFDKNEIIEHKNEIENKIKVLDKNQKEILSSIRNNRSIKSESNHCEEESVVQSPEKNKVKIDFRTKRPCPPEEPCAESFKRSKLENKATVSELTDNSEKEVKINSNRCVSEQQEERLRAHGCFYVFSHQQKLTRPLTEQDYFLMNFGLVSRDHIQYAPYGLSNSVRRTRRQLISKPKYRDSEWETISVKKFKPKMKVKEQEKCCTAESSLDSNEQSDISNSQNVDKMTNPSCSAEKSVESEMINKEVIYKDSKSSCASSNPNQTEVIVVETCSAAEVETDNRCLISSSMTLPVNKTVVKEEAKDQPCPEDVLSCVTPQNCENLPFRDFNDAQMPVENSESIINSCKEEKIVCIKSENSYDNYLSCLNEEGAKCVSSQDSGISTISQFSDVDYGSVQACQSIGFSSISSQELINSENDSSNDSSTLETELLQSNPIPLEQANA